MHERLIRAAHFDKRDDLRSRKDIVWLVRHQINQA